MFLYLIIAVSFWYYPVSPLSNSYSHSFGDFKAQQSIAADSIILILELGERYSDFVGMLI